MAVQQIDSLQRVVIPQRRGRTPMDELEALDGKLDITNAADTKFKHASSRHRPAPGLDFQSALWSGEPPVLSP